MSFSNPGYSSNNPFEEIFASQSDANYNKSNTKKDKWEELQQNSYKKLATITSQIAQVKNMMSKIGSNQDSLDLRNKMYGFLNIY